MFEVLVPSKAENSPSNPDSGPSGVRVFFAKVELIKLKITRLRGESAHPGWTALLLNLRNLGRDDKFD